MLKFRWNMRLWILCRVADAALGISGAANKVATAMHWLVRRIIQSIEKMEAGYRA